MPPLGIMSKAENPLPRFTPPNPIRSKNMAAIRSTDTMPEKVVRQALHSEGFRYRLHRRDLPGTPDIVLPRYKTVVFVHGCYWHGHRCDRDHQARTNTEYWREKISRNIRRDASHAAALREKGWSVSIIWECEVENATVQLLDRLSVLRQEEALSQTAELN